MLEAQLFNRKQKGFYKKRSLLKIGFINDRFEIPCTLSKILTWTRKTNIEYDWTWRNDFCFNESSKNNHQNMINNYAFIFPWSTIVSFSRDTISSFALSDFRFSSIHFDNKTKVIFLLCQPETLDILLVHHVNSFLLLSHVTL